MSLRRRLLDPQLIKLGWKHGLASSLKRTRSKRVAGDTKGGFACGFVLMCLSTLGWAQETASDTRFSFDIPQQRADHALTEFAEQADLTLMIPHELVQGKDANALVGEYTLEEGAEILLAGTGLNPEFSNQVVMSISADEVSVDRGEDMDIKKKAGFLAALAAVFTGANAQEPATTGETVEEQVLEQIIVTGSRIRGADSTSPVVTISRQDIERGGFATVEEIVDRLPQNFGAGATQDTGTDPNNDRAVGGLVGDISNGTSVNLRGLGASATLILLNGRRMSPSGASAGFTDISGIPVTAIERVEVLTDGASAIYGSDAIGGVINFILRDDYEGAETRLRYGSDSGGDASEVLFGQSFGTSWDGGNILFSYEYFDNDGLLNADRGFTATQDLTRYGGIDWRDNGGNPANIDAGGQLWAIPAGQDGSSLTAADFPVDAGGLPTAPLNRYNSRAIGSLLPEQERHSAFLHLSQKVRSAELFAEARFSTREFETVQDQEVPESIDVPDTNPFFVDPTGTGLTTVTVQDYALFDDLGSSSISGGADAYGVTLGVQFEFSDSWNGELLGNWAKEESDQRLNNFLFDRTALDAAVNQTDSNLAFNPFGDGSSTNPAVLDTIRASLSGREITASENELRAVGFHVDGETFDLPGGAVQLATGIDFRDESLLVVSDRGLPQELRSDLSRDVTAIYAELFFPFVTGRNSRPGVRRLELSIAARYEDYSDFGDTTNPKVGIVWSPAQSLTLRGTYGTSFKAPALLDLDVSNPLFNLFIYLPQFPFVDFGLIPSPSIVLIGGNENLRPEEATTWTAGFQWEPEGVEGLSLGATYFNVDFDDRIDVPFASFLDGFSDPRFASLLTVNPGDPLAPDWLAQVATVVNDPRFDPDLTGVSAADILSGVLPVGAILSAQRNNLARSVVTGLELQLSYDFETAFGSFDIGLNGNYLFDFERAFVATDPLVDEVDTLGRPVDLRARANLTWSRAEWSVSGFVNYTDGYTDNQSAPARTIDSLTTVDLNVTYDTGNNRGFLSETRLSLVVQNLFDEDPPFANTFGGLGYDSANHNPLGRFLSFQVTKEW